MTKVVMSKWTMECLYCGNSTHIEMVEPKQFLMENFHCPLCGASGLVETDKSFEPYIRIVFSKKLTRLEVIEDGKGRSYSRWNCNMMPNVQDDGRTLKIFVGDKK